MILLLASAALARPTDGSGLFTFDSADVIATYDAPGGTVKVWYASEGPSVTVLDDEDGSGVPDFVEMVGSYAEDVLAVYAEAGFRAPLSDNGEGGSDAMDVYLVDFAGNADGMYSAERCSSSPRQCSGYFSMENDFAGYGYPNLETAVRVLTSHELFHAVQAAYDAEEDVWFSEGTAVWAEDLYDPENSDFLAFCSAYLDDPGRSLDEPPAGPVPTFAYATGLWWWFLSNRYGDDFIVELLEATESSDDILVDMDAMEAARGGSLRDDFSTFARWNLATGRLAGVIESYPFAASLNTPRAEENGARIEDDNRYYPLATTYYKLEHDGGEVLLALEADAPELSFELLPVDSDGRLTEPLATLAGSATAYSFGELAAGDYWLVGTNPTLAESSTKVLTCLGGPDDVTACAPVGDTAADTGENGDDTGGETDGGGCGCDTTPGAASWVGLLALGVLIGRRRT